MLICNWRYHKRRIIDGKISYILSIGCTSIHKSKVHGIGRTVTKCMVVVQVQVQVEERMRHGNMKDTYKDNRHSTKESLEVGFQSWIEYSVFPFESISCRKTSLLRVTWFLKCVQTAYNCAKLACQAEGCWTCKTSSKVFSFSSLTLFWCHQEYFLSKSIEEHCQLVASQQHWVESHFQVTFLPPLSPAGPYFPSKSFRGREIFALRGLSCQGWRRRRGQAWPPCRSPSEPWERAGP